MGTEPTPKPARGASAFRTIGPYELQSLLGSGGMGEVYRAIAPGGSEVALKLIREDLLGKPEIHRRFSREARAAARLVHPHIIQILDFGTASARYYMAMELVEGGTLSDWRAVPPDGETLVEVFDQILAALAYAHARGVLHRDLKPENVLLGYTRGGKPVAKVMDFGVALFRDDSPADVSLEQNIVGTPAYMSPEQALRSSDASPASDLYAVGVMLFEALSGQLPFSGRSPAATLMAHIRQPVPELSLRAGYAADGPLAELVSRLLAKRPADRFLFAADVRAALRRVHLTGAPQAEVRVTLGAPISRSGATIVQTDARDAPVAPPAVGRFGLFGLREPPLLGRTAERDRLLDFAQSRLRAGRGGVVLIGGEMGMGKSRLAAALKEEVEEQGWMQAWAGDWSDAGASGDSGVRDAVRRGLGVVGATGEELHRRIAETLVRHSVNDAWEAAALAEFTRTDAAPGERRILTRENTRWALAERLLRRAASDRPVLLLFEDVHASDGSPLRLARWLLESPARPFPFLLVATWRSDIVQAESPVGQSIAWLEARREGDERLHSIRLGRLGEHDTQMLVRSCVPMEPGIANAIASRVTGVPRSAIEFVRHLVESGRLEGYGPAPTPEEILNALPEGLSALLRQRFDEAVRTGRATVETVDVWERLAFLGFRFDEALGAELLRVSGVEDSKRQLALAVDAGVETSILVEESPGVFRFENILLRDTLRERAEGRGRATRHELDAAEAKTNLFASDLDEHAAEIARHLRSGGRSGEALRFYLRGAEAARAKNQYGHAMESFREVETLIRDGVEDPEGWLDRALLGMAETSLSMAAHDEARRCAMEVRARATARGAEPPEANRVLAEVALRNGSARQARALFDVALRGYSRASSRVGVALARFGLGEVALRDGRLQDAEGYFRQAREDFDSAGDRRGEARSLSALGRTALATGLLDEAHALTSKARYRHHQIQDRHGEATALLTLGEVELARANAEGASAAFESAKESLLTVGDRHGAALATYFQGRTAELRDGAGAARRFYDEAMTQFVELGDQQLTSLVRLAMARALGEDGLWEQAQAEIERALRRDQLEWNDDPRFVELLVELARQSLFAGREALARQLLETAALKLERIAAGSPLYDRVDEVHYLLHELNSSDSSGEAGRISGEHRPDRSGERAPRAPTALEEEPQEEQEEFVRVATATRSLQDFRLASGELPAVTEELPRSGATGETSDRDGAAEGTVEMLDSGLLIEEGDSMSRSDEDETVLDLPAVNPGAKG